MNLRGVIRAACLLALACGCRAQISEKWFPVTTSDLALKSVPGDPGADAVQLDYSDSTNDPLHSRFIHRRIKVLTDKGRRYADVEIPVPEHTTISDLRARTIRPDGSEAGFSGKVFEKLLYGRYSRRAVVKAFTMPEVRAGSIVEYKYRLNWEQYVFDTTWILQHDLYTLKERFWLRPYQGKLQTPHGGDDTLLSYVYSNMPEGVAPKETAAGIELTLENVPAFTPEEWMPPEENFKPEVRFYYGGREIESPEIFWREAGREWHDVAERFMGRAQDLRAAAAEIIGEETDPRRKLERLYARAQRLRNLSFEPQRTRSETRKADLKPNENAAQALSHGYGFRNEIAELFAALARAAGFQADLLRASSREGRVFDQRLLSTQQLTVEIVRVKLEHGDIFFDPGTVFCPFGMVPWPYTSAAALRLDRDGGEFITIPTPTAEQTITRRKADMELSADGLLRGEITLEWKGNEALNFRLQALNTDQAGRRDYLEQNVLAWLPKGARIKMTGSDGWESGERPLTAHFYVEAPGFATRAGGRLLMPADLFLPAGIGPSGTYIRKYPIYFAYTFQEIDNVTVKMPDGYSADALPSGQDVKLESARFIAAFSASGQAVKTTRILVVNNIYFGPEQFPAVFGFLQKQQEAAEQPIVLSSR